MLDAWRLSNGFSRANMGQLRGTVKQVYLFFPDTLGFSKR
jgi:hypothetical protein